MLDIFYPHAIALKHAVQPARSQPFPSDTLHPTVLLVEPDMAHLPDRAAILTQAHYAVTSVRDVRELPFLRDHDPFTLALLSDLLGPLALISAATSVRRHWPLARILILGHAARMLEDHLYDEAVDHSCKQQDLLDLLAGLCDNNPWKHRLGRNEALMVAAILAGDASLYEDLIRPYECRIYMLALLYMQNAVDAEEVAQCAFIEAFHRLATLRAETRFNALLVRLTLDEAQIRLRAREKARCESPTSGPFLVQPLAEESLPQDGSKRVGRMQATESLSGLYRP